MSASAVLIDGPMYQGAVVAVEELTRKRAATPIEISDELHDEIHAAITLGWGWLNDNIPGWRDRMDTETLNLGSPCMCVLGQAEGDFYRALMTHGHASINGVVEPDWEWASEHGFSVQAHWPEDITVWRALTDAWSERIELDRILDGVAASVHLDVDVSSIHGLSHPM